MKYYKDGDNDDTPQKQDEPGDTETGDYNLGDDIGEKIGKDSHSEKEAL